MQATDRVARWVFKHPWWVAAVSVVSTLLCKPWFIERLDLAAYELLTGEALVTAGTPATVLTAGLLDQVLVALLPLVLMGQLTRRQPHRWQGRWVLALCAVPAAVALAALTGLGWTPRWLPPVTAMLGWWLGYVLWRGAHLRLAHHNLRQTQGEADATLRALTDAVFTIDATHRVQLLNPVAVRLAMPYDSNPYPNQGVGRPLAALLRLDQRDEDRLRDAIDTCLRQQRVIQVAQPMALMHRGQERLLRVTASPVLAAASAHAAGRAVLVLSDVTDSVRAAARLQHEASHDLLTGLPNRATLTEYFGHALTLARKDLRQLALLFIDLDRFKRINDSLGHRHGDTVLQWVATRLRAQVEVDEADAFIGRWGGDEFVVLLEDNDEGSAALALAHRLMEAVSHGIELDELDVHCSCSIGIALAPLQADSLDALLTLADLGMRRAKLHGGGRIEFSRPQSHPGGAVPWTRDVLTLEARLRRALSSGALELYYQPQLDVGSGEPVGLEALLRWHQGDGVVWSPKQFLDVAEESGLILDIGAWAIREATRQLGRWRRAGVPLLPVSINVSARQCLDRRLVHIVSAALSAEEIPASLIKLEITETTAMADVDQAMGLLAELRELGVGVAVDDFGTGYSSLAHLQRLPIDQIKIDQSFVRDIANDRHGAAIVRATIALAHELGVPVVAEGVEHASQLSFLTLHRCDIAQGFYFAHPLTGEAAGDYLVDHRRGPPTQPSLTFG